MKRKNQIILACIISSIILLIAYSVVNADTDRKVNEIYIFIDDLPIGTKIDQDMIKKIMVSQNEEIKGAVNNQDAILGKYLHYDVNAGQIVILENLYSQKPADTYGIVPDDTILYTLPLSAENANGWWIENGGLIDIYIKSKDNESIEIINDVFVIRIMDQFGNDAATTDNPAQMLCIGVNEEQARRLLIAQDSEIIKAIAKKQTERGGK